MTASDTHRAIEAVWRIESAKIIVGVARMVRDVGLAEELAQDALVAIARFCCGGIQRRRIADAKPARAWLLLARAAACGG